MTYQRGLLRSRVPHKIMWTQEWSTKNQILLVSHILDFTSLTSDHKTSPDKISLKHKFRNNISNVTHVLACGFWQANGNFDISFQRFCEFSDLQRETHGGRVYKKRKLCFITSMSGTMWLTMFLEKVCAVKRVNIQN